MFYESGRGHITCTFLRFIGSNHACLPSSEILSYRYYRYYAACVSLLKHNTWWGPTGLIQVPTTTMTRPNETSVSTYASIGSGDFFLGWNFNVAFSDHLELSVADTVGWDERSGSSTLLSMKYVPLENFAVGGLFDTNDNYQHTDLHNDWITSKFCIFRIGS